MFAISRVTRSRLAVVAAALSIATTSYGEPVLQSVADMIDQAVANKWYNAARPPLEEAERLLFNRAAARDAVEQIGKGDAVAALALFKELSGARRTVAVLKLGGFAASDVRCNMQKGAAAAGEQKRKDLESVVNISNELMEQAVNELPAHFFFRPTRPLIDSALVRVVAQHQPVMGEQISYDSASSQLQFGFESSRATLKQASVEVGPRFEQYRQLVLQKNPEGAAAKPAP